ncbi:MAG: hypothetical protein VX459_12895, partial [Pseudomonadota bacterium]|nr:hypothetical protein [Pseudomonadota bacterium]
IYFVSFVSYLSGLGKLDERRGKAFALLLYTNECGVILTYATFQFNGFSLPIAKVIVKNGLYPDHHVFPLQQKQLYLTPSFTSTSLTSTITT